MRRHAAGASVLNLFCYTGGFSLHAALGGATRVTSVDLAAPAIAAIEQNLALSKLPADAHERIVGDASTCSPARRAQRRRWDLVIVDPPSFAPSERAQARRAEGLPAARRTPALDVVEPGAVRARLVLEPRDRSGPDSSIVPGDLRLRHIAGAASDHPVLPAFPEGRYLKFLLFDCG